MGGVGGSYPLCALVVSTLGEVHVVIVLENSDISRSQQEALELQKQMKTDKHARQRIQATIVASMQVGDESIQSVKCN